MLQDAKTSTQECLGQGRPFVIEISKPKKRFIDLKANRATPINAGAVDKVEVAGASFLQLKTRFDTSRKVKVPRKNTVYLLSFEKRHN